MSPDAAIGLLGGLLGVVALLVSFPFALLAAVWGLAALERWMVTPTEHAAEVARLLDSEEPEAIETAVADLLHGDADRPGEPVRTSRERRQSTIRKLHRARNRHG